MKKFADVRIRDPFVLVDGGYYYLFGTSVKENGRNCFRGYKTTDLVNVEEEKIVFIENFDFWANQDFWAPEVHLVNGKYYMFASFKCKDRPRAVHILVSDTPLGNYIPLTADPITPKDWECLDGTLYYEDGKPYIVFCREWLEVRDGRMYAAELNCDLTALAGEPKLLFCASEAKWVKPFGPGAYVTDGPFLFKRGAVVHMIWSSFGENGYALGHAQSDRICGKWRHSPLPIYKDNGGHGMLFTKDGATWITLHSPNDDEKERAVFFPFTLNNVI
jgi:GH43 family beta-xylosidase